jgi:antitoxin component YwqK of YwqJK toxin-antitoxin module
MLKESGDYSMGKKEGEWLSFTPKGSLYIKRNFKDNIQIDSTIIK